MRSRLALVASDPLDSVASGCPVRMRGLELQSICRACHGLPPLPQRRLARKDTLCFEGDPADRLFAIIEGHLKEERVLEDGRTLGIRLLQPGDLAGAEALVTSSYQCTVQALGSARVCAVPVNAVEEQLRSRAAQGLALVRAFSQQIVELRDAMILLGSMSAEERIRIVLRQLTSTHARGAWLRLPLSRQELADLLGLALGTVSRTVQRFARDGDIELSGRNIRVLRPL
ncbi:MAG: Crp/Fnr family transcriptional regulator [Deltaproteobacteria bacterium]|nr:Crp/Fnr family transcriptional regulator [Deltaproteobacteria bacterium]